MHVNYTVYTYGRCEYVCLLDFCKNKLQRYIYRNWHSFRREGEKLKPSCRPLAVCRCRFYTIVCGQDSRFMPCDFIELYSILLKFCRFLSLYNCK